MQVDESGSAAGLRAAICHCDSNAFLERQHIAAVFRELNQQGQLGGAGIAKHIRDVAHSHPFISGFSDIHSGKRVSSRFTGSLCKGRFLQIVGRSLRACRVRGNPMQTIRKAIVPLAGLGTRLYPVSITTPKGLMPFALSDGSIYVGLELILEPLFQSGIEQACLVIAPDQRELYERFFAGAPERFGEAIQRKPALHATQRRLHALRERIVYALQEEPRGLGHAVWQGQAFAQGEPVLVALGDHLYWSKNGVPCAQQLISAYDRAGASVVGAHRVPLQKAPLYGIIQGEPTQIPSLYRIERVQEKPTLEEARDRLRTPGIVDEHCLAHFGLFAFSAEVWEALATIEPAHRADHGEMQLTTAEQVLLEREPVFALELEAVSLDYGTADEYRTAFQWVSQIPPP